MTEAGGRGGQTPENDRNDAAELRGHDQHVTEAGGRGGQTPENDRNDAAELRGTPQDRRFVDDAHRYALDSRIATGGMGEVWRGTDTVLGRAVAVKLLKPEYADDATFRTRFETEARHAAALHHPGVAAVYDFGEASASDGADIARPYLVMELVDGQPLSALLLPGQPLDPDATRDLLAQAADAIGAAHAAGIVHRDVKPANLLVTPDRTMKITDFGIARATEGMALTETGQVMGTPQYLSPEQAQGRNATPASDVYSLGVVAFECLAGRRPFVAENAVATALAHLREPVPDLPDDVPADLAAVVRRAMAKSPEQRFPDATAFARALRDPSSAGAPPGPAADPTQVLSGVVPPVPPPVPPSGATAPAAEPRGNRRKVPWLWILLALAVLAGVILVVVLTSGEDDPGPAPTNPPPSKSRDVDRPAPSPSPTEASPTEEQPSPTPTKTRSPSPTEEPSEEPTATEPPTEATPTEGTGSPTESPAAETSPTAGPVTSTAAAARSEEGDT